MAVFVVRTCQRIFDTFYSSIIFSNIRGQNFGKFDSGDKFVWIRFLTLNEHSWFCHKGLSQEPNAISSYELTEYKTFYDSLTVRSDFYTTMMKTKWIRNSNRIQQKRTSVKFFNFVFLILFSIPYFWLIETKIWHCIWNEMMNNVNLTSVYHSSSYPVLNLTFHISSFS